jgi:hypothetical protein
VVGQSEAVGRALDRSARLRHIHVEHGRIGTGHAIVDYRLNDPGLTAPVRPERYQQQTRSEP